jgi:tetratricopeptide (TPR) repeat protein
MSLLTHNPYIINKPVDRPPHFVGRSDVLREVLTLLDSPKETAMVLYGQRGIGKSSMLEHLKVQLSQQAQLCLIDFDLQEKANWPVAEVLIELAKKIAHTLNQAEPDLGEHPEITFQETWFPDILQTLPENTTLVLLFDEFDVIALPTIEQAVAGFFPYCHKLLNSDKRHLKCIFVSGRNIDDLDNLAVSLFRGKPPIKRLSLLTRQETEELVRLSEANHSLHWQDEAIESVWRYTRGHPFLTQQVCFQVWEQADKSESPPTARVADVENVLFDVLDASHNALLWLWEGLPPAERMIAAALAESGSNSINEEALEKVLYENGVHIIIRELQHAPRLLENWDLIELTETGYQYRVELLRRWIAEYKPLRRIQEEVDRIDPIADQLYQTAQKAHQSDDSPGAILKLREAIGLNPNHLGAQQQLADIFLAQGQAEEARELLENLYHYKPLAARSRLIQALLTLAQQSDVQSKQLQLYERVLTLEPKQVEANAKREEIWTQYAEKAFKQNDFETALNWYQKLGLSNKVAEIEQKIRDHFFDMANALKASQQTKRYQTLGLIALTLVTALALGWTYKTQQKQWFVQEKLIQTQENIAELERKAEQATRQNIALVKELKQSNEKTVEISKQVEEMDSKVAQLKQQVMTMSEKTPLGQLMSQLETGEQIVIIASHPNRWEAQKALKKLKAKYPELFYPQTEALPERVKNNLYQNGEIWEIFISGFYSYPSAKSLEEEVIKLELIKDTFIRRSPFHKKKRN